MKRQNTDNNLCTGLNCFGHVRLDPLDYRNCATIQYNNLPWTIVPRRMLKMESRTHVIFRGFP